MTERMSLKRIIMYFWSHFLLFRVKVQFFVLKENRRSGIDFIFVRDKCFVKYIKDETIFFMGFSE